MTSLDEQVLYPLNDTDYLAEDAMLYHATRTSGVFSGDEHFDLEAVSGQAVTIGTGIAWINTDKQGFESAVFGNRKAQTLDFSLSGAVYDRIDRIVIRWDKVKNNGYLAIKKGQETASPVAPQLQRDGSAYELGLYDVLRKAGSLEIERQYITDQRLDEDLCGIMRDGVTRIPTQQLYDSFKDFVDGLKEILDEEAAGKLLNQINELDETVDDHKNDTDNPHNIQSHTLDKTNPHSVTAAQVGAPSKTTRDMDIYLGGPYGDDAYSGNYGSPVKSWEKAYSLVPKWLDHDVTIHCQNAEGQTIRITGHAGGGTLTVKSAYPHTHATFKQVIVENCSARVDLEKILVKDAIDTTGGFVCQHTNAVYMTDCRKGEGPTVEVCFLQKGAGTLMLEDCVSNFARTGVAATWGGVVVATNQSSSGMTYTYTAQYGGTVHVSGTVPAGSTYWVGDGGLIVKKSGGAW